MPGNALRWFRPAPHRPRLPAEEVRRLYPVFRWQVFESAFVAYAFFYIVRNNFAPVAKEVGAALHYDKSMLGNIMAGTAIAYGVGKFVMGYFADRSDARKYVTAGMLLTALVNFAFGATSNYWTHLTLWTLNGLVQGMGYGPCTRGLAHWYSSSERGAIFGVWNISHNIGGGIAGFLAAWCAAHWGWPSAFFVPGALAVVCAGYLFWRMRDSPESEGLPPVEEYKRGTSAGGSDFCSPGKEPITERELNSRELLQRYILPNRMLWVVAIANVFVYIARYAMLDWGPTYLKEVKGATITQAGFSTTVLEFAGAGGMLTMGWLSDKLGGRRGRVSVITMVPLAMCFVALMLAPEGMLWLDIALFGVIGFCVYTPVMFSGVMSLDLTSKKAVGTAAGFVGFFGYVGRVIESKGMAWLVQHYGWNAAIAAVVVCTIVGAALLALTWNVTPRQHD